MLDALGIAYALGGSMASSLVGEPRSTVDVDIAIKLENEAGAALLERATAEFYVPIDAARAAIDAHSSFNLVDTAYGLKVDLFVLGEGLCGLVSAIGVEPGADRQMDHTGRSPGRELPGSRRSRRASDLRRRLHSHPFRGHLRTASTTHLAHPASTRTDPPESKGPPDARISRARILVRRLGETLLGRLTV
ncbi:MAG TPA: hypothetical protein VIK54_11820 [Acidimicrobiia bacterium]